MFDRGPRPRRHGPPDHHRGLARGLPADADAHEEAALALGATRWEMIRMAVLPFGRSGIISASMLGLGRALGETMAVAIVLSATGRVTSTCSLDQPVDDRREHRADSSPRPPARRQRPDRVRPDPVHHHPAGQLRRPAGSSTAATSSRGRTDDHRPPTPDGAAQGARAAPLHLRPAARAGRVGAPRRSLAGIAVVFWIRPSARARHNIAGWLVTSGLLYLLLVFTSRASSRAAQGHGPPGDRRRRRPRSSSPWSRWSR